VDLLDAVLLPASLRRVQAQGRRPLDAYRWTCGDGVDLSGRTEPLTASARLHSVRCGVSLLRVQVCAPANAWPARLDPRVDELRGVRQTVSELSEA
jgi:hypothetical protein